MIDGSTNFSLHLADSSKHLSAEEQEFLHGKIHDLVEKHCTEHPHIHIDIHELNKTLRGEKSYQTNIRLVGSRRDFVTNTEQYGSLKSVMEALNMMEQQVKRHSAKKKALTKKKQLKT